MACVIGYQLFAPPVVGLANNGDFERLMDEVGLQYTVNAYGDRYFNYINLTFASGAPRQDTGLVSSQQLLVELALFVNRVVARDSLFDLRVLGAVNAGCFLAATWVVLRAARSFVRSSRFAVLALWAVMFTDVGYFAYFNSIYSEPASLIFFMLIVGISLRMIAAPRPGGWLAASYAAAAALFVFAKAQNVATGVLLAGWGACLVWRWATSRWRATAIALAGFVLACSLTAYADAPRWTREANLYNAVFAGILAVSPSPADDLSALGLDGALAKYARTNYYHTAAPVRDPSFVSLFYDRISQSRIVWFYLTHPRRMLAVADEIAPGAFLLRPPGYGNFPKASGYPPQATSRRFAYWSSLRARVPGRLWILGSALIGILIAGARALIRPARSTERLLWGLFALIGLSAAAQFVVKFAGNGLMDNVKLLYLFNASVDLGVTFVVAWAIEARARKSSPERVLAAVMP
jgi:hypothetical protein